MKRRTFLAAAATALASPVIHAQGTWPKGQPIRIIVPFPAGAANDAMRRLAGQQLQDRLGATVVVENRPGGSALIGTTAVRNAAPDGYTLLASAFNHIILNHVVRNVTFDPQTDFAVIGRTARAPLLVVMAPQQPQKTIGEVLAAAKAKPEAWTAAIPALGALGTRVRHSDHRRAGIPRLRLPVLVRAVGAEGHAARDLRARQRVDARDDARSRDGQAAERVAARTGRRNDRRDQGLHRGRSPEACRAAQGGAFRGAVSRASKPTYCRGRA